MNRRRKGFWKLVDVDTGREVAVASTRKELRGLRELAEKTEGWADWRRSRVVFEEVA